MLVPLLGGRIGENFPALLIDLGLLGLGLAVYGALFALVGAWFKRPLLTGLVFVFGWEPIAVVIPGYMKNLTVAFYLQGLAPHAMPQDGTMSLVQSLLQAFQGPGIISAPPICRQTTTKRMNLRELPILALSFELLLRQRRAVQLLMHRLPGCDFVFVGSLFDPRENLVLPSPIKICKTHSEQTCILVAVRQTVK